jgi:hypothetical protein
MSPRWEPESVEAWVERTCREQGVPVKVRDPATIRAVALLLRSGSELPGRHHATGVEAVEPPPAGSDGHPVEDRGDDGAAAVDGEVGPPAA